MEYIILGCTLLLLVVFVMCKEYISTRNLQRRFLEKVFEIYGVPPERDYRAEEMEHIRMYYLKHPLPHQIDDITWDDLDMDSIYRSINVSGSAAGDEYLYYMLRSPVYEPEKMEHLEELIRHFMKNSQDRQAAQRILFGLGRMGKYSIYEYLENLDTLGERSSGKYLLSDLMIFVCIAMMFGSLPIGVVCLLGVLCYNITGYFREYKEIEPYITSFRYINRLLSSAEQLGRSRIGGISMEKERLLECFGSMKSFIRDTYLIVFTEKGNGNPLGVLVDYLRMVFYLDLIQFNKALHAVRGHIPEIDEMITLLGQLDAVVTIGSYRNSLQEGYCIPSIRFGQGAGRHMTIEQVYHPLLADPVKNSISADKGVLLTGSNASGKSTFLRAVAVNAVLAQTIHTCLARCYEAPAWRIYSSMSLRDDLVSGQSYYMVEIRSIKRILDQVEEAAKEHSYVLCFVDEVLRGTNTVERIAASTQIMKMLSLGNALCFAATHDVELTKLLESEYDNYHFEERIEEDDIFFPYKLMEGPATTRNAIALLKMLGYDERIISDAEAMAEKFLAGGGWQR